MHVANNATSREQLVEGVCIRPPAPSSRQTDYAPGKQHSYCSISCCDLVQQAKAFLDRQCQSHRPSSTVCGMCFVCDIHICHKRDACTQMLVETLPSMAQQLLQMLLMALRKNVQSFSACLAMKFCNLERSCCRGVWQSSQFRKIVT